jgi:hypothetical protein
MRESYGIFEAEAKARVGGRDDDDWSSPSGFSKSGIASIRLPIATVELHLPPQTPPRLKSAATPAATLAAALG